MPPLAFSRVKAQEQFLNRLHTQAPHLDMLGLSKSGKADGVQMELKSFWDTSYVAVSQVHSKDTPPPPHEGSDGGRLSW